MQQGPNAFFGPFPDMGRSWTVVRHDPGSVRGKSGFPADASPPSSRFPQARFSARSYRGLSLDVLDYALFLPSIWLTCALGISLRLIGPGFVVVPTGFCLLYGALRRAVPPRLLSVYFAFCVLVAVLSAYQLLPTSWQVHFLEDAIVRQLVPTFGFFAVAWASKAYFRRRILYGDVFTGAPIIISLGMVLAPAVMFQQGHGYEGDYSVFATIALLGSFINNMCIAFFYILGAVFLTKDWRRYAALALMLALAVGSHFAQFRLLTAITLAALVGAPGRKVVIGAVAVLLGIYAVGVNFVPQIMLTDPNDGLRLAFINDTFMSVGDTYGIGIGYGKEVVRWRYEFPDMPVFTFLPYPATMTHDQMLQALSTGVENSFAAALMRTGVLGCFLLVAAVFAAFPPRNLPRDVRNHAATLFGMMFIGLFVNPPLESPIAAVGVGFVYGYLLALRAAARTRRPQIMALMASSSSAAS